MKINNINTEDEYPDNYDDVDSTIQKVIVTYLNEQQDLANDYYDKHIMNEDEKNQYLALYNHQLDLLCGGKNVLSVMGIKAEYNWPNHKSKWFLATKTDYEARESTDDSECTIASTVEAYAGWPKPRGTRNEKSTISYTH